MRFEQKITRRSLLQAAGAVALAGMTAGCGRDVPASMPAAASAAATPVPAMAPTQYRAMWISYLDWPLADFSSQAAFETSFGAMLDNCAALGLNTVIAQVRPFGDALYRSALFPWSHLCTGTQGQDPGYDPLDCMIRLAHARGLSLEAWINPYRLWLNNRMPAELAAAGLTGTNPDWCITVGEGIYLNPAIPEAADYVVRGITELLQNYPVDGVHFDDYFYPTTDAWVDQAQYAAAGGGLSLDEWRRRTVTALVRDARDAVKAQDSTLRFGISPQGNPDNNYQQQYSDVQAWINDPAGPLVDYICPQLYWGYGYQLKSGSTRFAYENISAEWLDMPRDSRCALYFGLGAYRIGDGDGGANPDSKSQWQSGSQLARMVQDLEAAGADGYALFRYEFLYHSAYPDLAVREREALAAENTAQDGMA